VWPSSDVVADPSKQKSKIYVTARKQHSSSDTTNNSNSIALSLILKSLIQA